MNENFDVTYKALFRRYYPSLIFYATRLVGEEEAEDVVQDVFVELWKRKDHIEIGDQIQAFLYHAVYTRALNVLKHRSVEDGYCVAMEEINQRRAEFYQPDNNEVIRRIEDKELRKEIHDAINELPDKCKEVFKLSYLHDMKNKGIADIQKALGIYLMQNNIESKERKQTNQEIASQLQFIVFLSGNINIIKQLHGILQRHLSNVMLLLRSYPEHNIQE